MTTALQLVAAGHQANNANKLSQMVKHYQESMEVTQDAQTASKDKDELRLVSQSLRHITRAKSLLVYIRPSISSDSLHGLSVVATEKLRR